MPYYVLKDMNKRFSYIGSLFDCKHETRKQTPYRTADGGFKLVRELRFRNEDGNTVLICHGQVVKQAPRSCTYDLKLYNMI